MRSKEEQVLEPFFNSTRHWHFEELLEESGVSRSQLMQWLKAFEKKGMIKRIKPRKKMPYYTAASDKPEYQNRKRLFGLKKLADSGLLNHLSTLDGAKLVILFGSFSRYDWHEHSDIDLFIYGDDDMFEQAKYEVKLGREIQLFNAKDKKDLKRMGPGLLQNILEGFMIKGDLARLGMEINA